ncbi:hypothetical protein C9J44_12180 [Photobacterium sp. GB-27]|uniref:hypothetical protein n=1 Tax=Photobacterium sp. GB-27 TaxID=2022109 RepID=UPI000D16D792|nr:hypothetical protein [Photobacterium sp. GB-27]PSV35771.1 hypothetical protein C9J44_12180 [Photobacterium sp. GB-27]
MAHTFDVDAATTLHLQDKKSYEVTIKGLIAQLFDIVFNRSKKSVAYSIEDIPVHLQKDIGIYR